MARKHKPRANPERHGRTCTICRCPYCEQIEADFIAWTPAAEILKRYGIKSKTTLYLHAGAQGLFVQRDRNIRHLLGRIIEKNQSQKLSGAGLISAIALLSKIDADGRSAERVESVGSECFAGWTLAEVKEFVDTGARPTRYQVQPQGENSE